VAVWNSTYTSALKDKKSQTEAEGEAFKIANGVAKAAKEKASLTLLDGQPGMSSAALGKPAGPGPQAFPGAVPEMLSANKRFSDDQPRDSDGKFSGGGSSETKDPTDAKISEMAPHIVSDFKEQAKEEDGHDNIYEFLKDVYRPYMSEKAFDKVCTAVFKAAGPGVRAFPGAVPEMLSVRYSEDQPRDKDGKFGSGGANEPHNSDAAKQAGADKHPSGLDPAGVATLQEHLVEAVKEDNHVWATALSHAISGDKFSKADKEAFIEHYQDMNKEGDFKTAQTMWDAFHRSMDGTRETFMNIERRYTSELRAMSQGDEMALVGYAALFNSPSKDLGGFIETIAPGAFTKALETRSDVKCLFNHSADHVLGRTTANTLTLTQDDKGLAFRCMLDPNQQAHRDLHASVKRGDISECSFAFAPDGADGDNWEDRKDPQGNWFISRTLKNVKLFDVSAVTYPAYSGTSVQSRSENVTPEIRSIIGKLVAKRSKVEKRDSESVEDMLNDLRNSLCEKFPCDPAPNGGCCPSWGKYYICETYDDHVIVSMDCPGPSQYYSIPYAVNPDGDDYIFGTPVPVEKEWVPSERTLKSDTEFREMKSKHMAAIAAQHQAAAADHQATADAHTQAAGEHQANADANTNAADAAADEAKRMEKCEASMGDCSIKGCRCQNYMADAREAWDESDDDQDYKDEKDEDRSARKGVLFQVRAGDKVRTKKVGGKNLPASAFASVGDPNDTSTWKLPIHDKSHADNAAARLNQTNDIDKEAADKKIKAAQKKFGETADRAFAEEMELRFRLSLTATEVRG